jgi:thioredoxin-related protein
VKNIVKLKLFVVAVLVGLVGLKSFEFLSKTDDSKSPWPTDYKKALETARTEKKTVLVNFTGSDWCVWCIKLKKEVFETVEFSKYATNNLILLEIDFPNGKPQSDELRKQNAELQRQFGIEGFPNILVLNSEGKLIGKMGYVPGGPQPFIDAIKSFVVKNNALDTNDFSRVPLQLFFRPIIGR